MTELPALYGPGGSHEQQTRGLDDTLGYSDVIVCLLLALPPAIPSTDAHVCYYPIVFVR